MEAQRCSRALPEDNVRRDPGPTRPGPPQTTAGTAAGTKNRPAEPKPPGSPVQKGPNAPHPAPRPGGVQPHQSNRPGRAEAGRLSWGLAMPGPPAPPGGDGTGARNVPCKHNHDRPGPHCPRPEDPQQQNAATDTVHELAQVGNRPQGTGPKERGRSSAGEHPACARETRVRPSPLPPKEDKKDTNRPRAGRSQPVTGAFRQATTRPPGARRPQVKIWTT